MTGGEAVVGDGGQAVSRRPLTMGKRLYRGVFFALLVGVVGAILSVMPAMFVQGVFMSNVDACQQAQQQELDAYGQVQTDCDASLSEEPTWLPGALIGGGAAFGLVAGFGYGLVSPKGWKMRQDEGERPWLPF